MKDLSQKIKESSEKFEELRKSFNLGKMKTHLFELEAKTTDPDFWQDREKAKNIMQEFGDLKAEVEEVEKLEKDMAALKELVKADSKGVGLESEIRSIEERVEKFKLRTFLSGLYDRKNAILSIHAGQGGVEAMDWASMLYRMYLRFCERRGWKTQVVDLSEGEEAGIKSLTLRVNGRYAYGYLKGETGTHRLVRQSPFNADKLRQTSFALVEVLPELAEVDLPSVEIADDEVEWQFFRASTQGGQNVQKVSSAVRLIHKPTNIVVTSQQERSQEQNRKIALNLLRAKLWAKDLAMKEKKVKKLKGEYRPPSWGNQIRSYVLHPYKMVKDLRTQVEISDPEAVLDGELDQFIETQLKMTAY